MKLRTATFNIKNLFARFDIADFSSGRVAEIGRCNLPSNVKFLADFDGDDLMHFNNFRSLMCIAAVSMGDDRSQYTTALAIDEVNVYLQTTIRLGWIYCTRTDHT